MKLHSCVVVATAIVANFGCTSEQTPSVKDDALDIEAVQHEPPPDRISPNVILTGPVSATVESIVTATAKATDNVGVEQVDFIVDGIMGKTSTTEPHSVQFNVPGPVGTVLQIRAIASDAAGNEGEDHISVLVTAVPGTLPP